PPRRAPAPPSGGDGGLGDFLQSRQGKQLQKEVVRGVFGMLRKRF
ncbi:MAG: ATPase, partial [Solirubrobacterales bacterium]|nr:ATPase [Solirubrobacterales bacterium]